jgi:protein-disulfide isomerase-like protein with CxxC motif
VTFTAQQCMELVEKATKETALKACLRIFHQHGREMADDLAKHMGIATDEFEVAIDTWFAEKDREYEQSLMDEAEKEHYWSMREREAA